MSYKVKEEIPLGNGNYFICNFDKQAETFRRPEGQSFRNICTKFFRPRAAVHFESFVGIL